MNENLEPQSEESTDGSCTPPRIREIAESVNCQVLPAKSRERYEAAYVAYTNWKASNKINSTSENIMKAYFLQLSETKAPSTLWAVWSMLKSTINQKEGNDISQYKQLTAFLKKKSDGYEGKKCKVLSSEEMGRFLKEAPDNQFLVTKVALIFGISGACRREELANLKVKNVQHQGKILVVKIPDTKTKSSRTFIIEGELLDIVNKYESLRPPKTTADRFFLNYHNGKCTNQVIGKNKFGEMPKQIAEFLNLPDPKLYTGRSFHKTSTTLLAKSGADLISLKSQGGCENRNVAEEQVEEPISKKRKIERIMSSSVSMAPSTSDQTEEIKPPPMEEFESVYIPEAPEDMEDDSDSIEEPETERTHPVFQFHNCTVNIHHCRNHCK